MKEIILIRHAKVAMEGNIRMASSELVNFVSMYDIAALEEISKPSQELHNLVNEADYLLTSKLFRTIASAEHFEKAIDEQNELFNEAGIPTVHIPWFRFKAKTWLVILRLLLFTGRGKGDDSFKASNARAKRAVDRLLELSEEHDRVVLVGHGGMNFFMRRILLKQGWKLQRKGSSKNWGLTRLVI